MNSGTVSSRTVNTAPINFVVRGATLPDGTSTDLFVSDGQIVDSAVAGATIIDAAGLTALPGLVDLHTHLREPGYEQSETVLTGSRAAAAGGFTAVHAMANTSPVADTAGVVEQVESLGDQHGYV
ncbi:MAG: dihydroorotase, partial [Actinomycetota bacterium]|nr:dihydroorotase [Actinomycetota bacterium]